METCGNISVLYVKLCIFDACACVGNTYYKACCISARLDLQTHTMQLVSVVMFVPWRTTWCVRGSNPKRDNDYPSWDVSCSPSIPHFFQVGTSLPHHYAIPTLSHALFVLIFINCVICRHYIIWNIPIIEDNKMYYFSTLFQYKTLHLS